MRYTTNDTMRRVLEWQDICLELGHQPVMSDITLKGVFGMFSGNALYMHIHDQTHDEDMKLLSDADEWLDEYSTIAGRCLEICLDYSSRDAMWERPRYT